MEHDQRRIPGRRGGKRSEIVDQVTANKPGRVVARDRDSGGAALLALRLTGPDQTPQPRHIVLVAHVERVEVKPSPPGDVGQSRGQRHRAFGSAAQHRVCGVGGVQEVSGEAVAVAIREQGQPPR